MSHANAGRTLVATGSASGQLLVFTISYNRGVAQLVARLLWEQNAAGSSPVTPTISSVHNESDEHSIFLSMNILFLEQDRLLFFVFKMLPLDN